jgi:cell division protease FtsH
VRIFKRTGEFRTPQETSLRPDATGFDTSKPSIGFGDVAGLDSVVQDLRDVVGYVANPSHYELLGARPPTGILLFGEPGCGKTLLARALAGEVGVPFYFVSATSFVERFVGLGASRIRELFDTAGADGPCIVFIDELDAVGRKRSDGAGDREFDHTLNQLLVELDGFLGATGVITIAATNRLELLDPALVRPGRFDRHIEITRPDREGRDAVLRLHAAARPCAADVDWSKVAEATDGRSPAELAALVNEAALLAARNGGDVIAWSDVRSALDRLIGGAIRSTALSEADLDRRAAHEAGHVLVALRFPFATPRVRSSILSCGHAGAATDRIGADRGLAISGPELLAELVVLMGGRAAEESVFGSPSTLAEGDIASARELAVRIERMDLRSDGVPNASDELVVWARREASRLVAAEPDTVESIAASLRSNTSMFVEEIRCLLPG